MRKVEELGRSGVEWVETEACQCSEVPPRHHIHASVKDHGKIIGSSQDRKHNPAH
jgi:hypothetical protein